MPFVQKYKFDEFIADVNAVELHRGGARLRLQMQPFQVLVALLERPREVVTREELRLRLWPQDTFVDFDHGLNTAMAKLRDVLGDSAAKPRYIETIAKRGYRFLGEVEAVPVTGLQVAATPAAAPEPGPRPMLESGAAAEMGLPRAPRHISRSLFVLAQVLYLVFYTSALFNLESLDRAAYGMWPQVGSTIFVIYLVTAMVGVAVRLYLITASAFDYHLLGEKYRIMFPALFVLDMVWALGPFLLIGRLGLGLALGASATLIYLPFAQRVLIKMIYENRVIR